MLSVNATEFRHNQGKYLEKLKKESIEITKNNKVIAVVSYPEKEIKRRTGLLSIVGTLHDAYKDNMPTTKEDDKKIIQEQILEKYENFA